jgi:hypothetical protein
MFDPMSEGAPRARSDAWPIHHNILQVATDETALVWQMWVLRRRAAGGAGGAVGGAAAYKR